MKNNNFTYLLTTLILILMLLPNTFAINCTIKEYFPDSDSATMWQKDGTVFFQTSQKTSVYDDELSEQVNKYNNAIYSLNESTIQNNGNYSYTYEYSSIDYDNEEYSNCKPGNSRALIEFAICDYLSKNIFYFDGKKVTTRKVPQEYDIFCSNHGLDYNSYDLSLRVDQGYLITYPYCKKKRTRGHESEFLNKICYSDGTSFDLVYKEEDDIPDEKYYYYDNPYFSQGHVFWKKITEKRYEDEPDVYTHELHTYYNGSKKIIHSDKDITNSDLFDRLIVNKDKAVFTTKGYHDHSDNYIGPAIYFYDGNKVTQLSSSDSLSFGILDYDENHDTFVYAKEIDWNTHYEYSFYNGNKSIRIPTDNEIHRIRSLNNQTLLAAKYISNEPHYFLYYFPSSGEPKKIEIADLYGFKYITDKKVIYSSRDNELYVHDIENNKRVLLSSNFSNNNFSDARFSFNEDHIVWFEDTYQKNKLKTVYYYDGKHKKEIYKGSGYESPDCFLGQHKDKVAFRAYDKIYLYDPKKDNSADPAIGISKFIHKGKNSSTLLGYFIYKGQFLIRDREGVRHNNNFYMKNQLYIYDGEKTVPFKTNKTQKQIVINKDNKLGWIEHNWETDKKACYIATFEDDLKISNIGDGRSIRLKWPKNQEEGKATIYKIWRKDENTLIPEGQENNWKSYYEPVLTTKGEQFIKPTKEEDFVTFIDTQKDTDPDDQTNASYKGPTRGTVYDYIVEVLQKNNGSYQPINTIGPKKGVTEPFVMLVRGWGEDNDEYWLEFKDFLERDAEFSLTANNINGQPVPKTIWDTALGYDNPKHDPYIYPGKYHIGQLSAYQAGSAIFQELEIWLDELKEETKRTGTDEHGEEIELESPDYTPEQFIILSHSLGGPTSRYLEHLINQRHDAIKDGNMHLTNVPKVAKNIMLSPATLGGALAWTLQNTKQPMTFITEAFTFKEKEWPASQFLIPNNCALFNKDVKPSPKNKYVMFQGDSWWRGGFGGVNLQDSPLRKNPLLSGIRHFLSSKATWLNEADGFDPDMKNDMCLTVKMSRGQFTNKIWKKLDKHFNFPSDQRKDFEFQPLPENLNIQPVQALNHHFGMVEHEDMQNSVLPYLDLPIDLPAPLLLANHIMPDEIQFIDDHMNDTAPIKEQSGTLISTNELELDFNIPTNEKWVVSAYWDQDDSDIKMNLTDPDENVFDGDLNIISNDFDYIRKDNAVIYVLNNPKIGNWTISVQSTNPNLIETNVQINHFSASNVRIEHLFSPKTIDIDDAFPIRVRVLEDEETLSDAQITAKVTQQSNGEITLLNLQPLADNIHEVVFNNTNEIDDYSIDLNALVTLSNGNTITLNSTASFKVMDLQDISIGEIQEEKVIFTENNNMIKRIEIKVPVMFSGSNPFIITANLYDAQENFIAQGRGEVTGDPGSTVSATLSFEGNDIHDKNVDGPFTIKDFSVFKRDKPDYHFNTELSWETTSYSAKDFAFQDEDQDGLSNAKEKELGTDPTLVDSDSDGLSDYEEIYFDGDEHYTPGADTDPLNPDTDLDGYSDSEDLYPLDSKRWKEEEFEGQLWIQSDKEQGSQQFTDNSASAHEITVTGDTHHKDSAIYFDGDGDGLNITDHDDFNFGSEDFTIDFWFKAEDINRMSALVSQGSSNSPSWEVWLCQNDYIKFKAMTTGYLYASVKWKQTDYFLPGVWYHVTVMRKGDNLKLYVDGVLQDSEESLIPNVTMRDSNADLTIGHSWSKNDFKGYIDKIKIIKGEALKPDNH